MKREEKNFWTWIVGCGKSRTFAAGEMAEWSIAAVLKTVDLNGSGGSNPSLSASKKAARKAPPLLFAENRRPLAVERFEASNKAALREQWPFCLQGRPRQRKGYSIPLLLLVGGSAGLTASGMVAGRLFAPPFRRERGKRRNLQHTSIV